MWEMSQSVGRIGAVVLALACAPTQAQDNVRGWYAHGQVFIVWRNTSPEPTTYAIYASQSLQTSTANMTLVGRLFKQEWEGQRLRNLQAGVTLKLPGPTPGSSYQLAADEGAFVFTPHSADTLYFAVVKHGDTAVANPNRDQIAFNYDPLNEPVRPHAQFSAATTGGYPFTAFVVWVDGRMDPEDGRPDFPVMGNEHRNGVPHVFAVTAPLSPPAGPLSCAFVLHGGEGAYQNFMPGEPTRASMSLELTDGVVVTPDDTLYFRYATATSGVTTESNTTTWFGYAQHFDPFDEAPRVDPPGDTVIVNYTSRRVFWFLERLLSPGSPIEIDPARVAVIGHSAGAWGTGTITRQRPELFCAAVAHCTPLNFNDGPLPNPFRGKFSQNLATNILSPTTGTPITHIDTLRPYVRLSPGSRDFALTRLVTGLRDDNGEASWTPVLRTEFDLANASGQGLMLFWDEREHGVDKWTTDEDDLTDDPAHCDPWPDLGQWIAPVKTYRHSAQYLVDMYRNDQSYPGFFNDDQDLVSAGRQPDPGPGDPCVAGIDAMGTWGGYYDWDMATIVDQADRWECTLFLANNTGVSIDDCPVAEAMCDLSPRRTQAFNPPEGTPIAWALVDVGTQAVLQSGATAAGAEGLVTATGLVIRRDPDHSRLILRVTCNDIDFNNDEIYPDTQDLLDYLNVFAGGACSNDPDCDDLDFNNDEVHPDSMDLGLFLLVFGGGSC